MSKRIHQNPMPGGMIRQINFKAVAAAGLLALMALLWLRVFLRKGPQQAEAATDKIAEISDMRPLADPSKPVVRIRPVDLPFTAGIHDRIGRNPFDIQAADWLKSDFQSDRQNSANPELSLQKQHEQNMKTLSDQLVLEAVMQGPDGKLLAFIRDQVLHVGSRFTVRMNDQKYVFVVSEITENSLVLKWQAFSITVVMSPSFQMD